MDVKKFEKSARDIFAEYNVPGFDCIVYRDHEQLCRIKGGMSDIENQKEIRGDELYLLFSMTKMLTCTAALQLLEQGKYMLFDPVSKFLPEFERMKITESGYKASNMASITSGVSAGEKGTEGFDGYAKNPITIRDLFTMCGGLDYALDDEPIKKAIGEGKKTTRELVAAMAEKTLGFEPGERFRYSLCHDVIGALIEVLSHKKFGEYLKENIFDPLGMKNTFFGIPKDEESLSRMMVRYRYDANGSPERLPLECPFILTDEYESGGAGLVSCTEDYAVFLDAIACGGVSRDGKRILSEGSVGLMGTNYLKGRALDDFSASKAGYGYGLGVRVHIDKTESGSLSPIGEFGWDGAAGAYAMADTDNKLSLTYFQHIHGWDGRMHKRLMNALYGSLK